MPNFQVGVGTKNAENLCNWAFFFTVKNGQKNAENITRKKKSFQNI